MAPSTLDEIRKLSVVERIRLMEEIWDSVAEGAQAVALPVTEAQRRELDERVEDAAARPGVGSSWGEVKVRLLGGE